MSQETLKKGRALFDEKYAGRQPEKVFGPHDNRLLVLTFVDSVKEQKGKVRTKTTSFYFKTKTTNFKDWHSSSPGELISWQQSTQALDRYFAIGGQAGGKALASSEIPPGYSMYNRNNRWVKGPKAVWISDSLLMDPEELTLNDREQVVLDYLLTAGYSDHGAKCMIIAGRAVSPREDSA